MSNEISSIFRLLGVGQDPGYRSRRHLHRVAPLGDSDPEEARGADAGSRVAVVTGGSRGFGLALVRELAQRDMRVVMASRSPARGRAALDLLGTLADRVAVRPLDITDEGSMARLVSWLAQYLGRCDILINNAAVQADNASGSLDVDMAVVRRSLETNLLGTWRLVQAIAPLMRVRHYGRVVNISDDLGDFCPVEPSLPAYRVSQAAINALTRILADDLADDGILVNACFPGPLRMEVAPAGDTASLTLSADTVMWLATLPDNGPTGGFFRDGRAVPR
jgi:NAD(P)-dependent dehydrogenase (short-subunit alcohol dehydrogenase family)